MTWNILKDIHLRKLEYRMRNCDALRFTVCENIDRFVSRHGKDTWAELRPLATNILVEAEAALDEARNLLLELELLNIPADHNEAQNTNLRIANHAKLVVEKVIPMRNTMRWVIEAEDEQCRDPKNSTPTQ